MNRVVQHLFQHYMKPSQEDWDEKLPVIASRYNNAIHSTTGVTPKELHLGWKPRSALDFLVNNLGDYLTSMDNAIRARGTMLLAEGTNVYKTKPLSPTQLNSLAVFFATRVADKAARSEAMVGVCGLLQRKKEFGQLMMEDVLRLMGSVFTSTNVRALPLRGRQASFEAMICLLENYKSIVAREGSEVVEGIIAAIDGEKDPRCLLLTFKIVELAAALFSTPHRLPLTVEESLNDDLDDVAVENLQMISKEIEEELFDPPNDRVGITREQLALALEKAILATPMFAELAIPVILDRMSAGMHSAKLDSLRLLEQCWKRYGRPAVLPHVLKLWTVLRKEVLPLTAQEMEDAMIPRGVDIAKDEAVREAALACLTESARALDKIEDISEIMGAVYDDQERNELVALVMADQFVNEMYACVKEAAHEGSSVGAKDGETSGQHKPMEGKLSEREEKVLASSSLIAALVRVSPTTAKSIANDVCLKLLEAGGWDASVRGPSLSLSPSPCSAVDVVEDEKSGIEALSIVEQQQLSIFGSVVDTSDAGTRPDSSASTIIVFGGAVDPYHSLSQGKRGALLALSAVNIILESVRQTVWDAAELIPNSDYNVLCWGEVMVIDDGVFKMLLNIFIRVAEVCGEGDGGSMTEEGNAVDSAMSVAVNGLRILGTFPFFYGWMDAQHRIAETLVDLVLGRKLAGDDSLEDRQSLRECDAKLAKLCSDALVDFEKGSTKLEKWGMVRSAENFVTMAVKRLLGVVEKAKDTEADAAHMQNVDIALQALSNLACSSMETVSLVLPTLNNMLNERLIPAMTSEGGLEFVGAVLRALGEFILPNCGELNACGHTTLGSLVGSILRNFLDLDRCGVVVPEKILSGSMKAVRLATQLCNTETQREIVQQIVSSQFESQSQAVASEGGSFHGKPQTALPDLGVSRVCITGGELALVSETGNLHQRACVMASALISLRPEVEIPSVWDVLRVLANVCTEVDPWQGSQGQGDGLVVAMAIASILNKMKVSEVDKGVRIVVTEELLLQVEGDEGKGLRRESIDELRRMQRVVGALAWIGKGLSMRGHMGLAAIVDKFMGLLQSVEYSAAVSKVSSQDRSAESPEDVRRERDEVIRAAARGLGLIVAERHECLNKATYGNVHILHRQRVFTSMVKQLLEILRLTKDCQPRAPLYIAFGHLLKETPPTILLQESKVLPVLLESLSALSAEPRDRDVLHACLLVLSFFLTDTGRGKMMALEVIGSITAQLLPLARYPHSMLVRETAIQCLAVIASYPHASIYPHRNQVIPVLAAAKGDVKRAVRKEAVKCYGLWLAVAGGRVV
ncbi:hypothetical protein CBR_g26190 [Chara braunii]|uniref:MMS19 nucleotide excision repair protein n=1 Tax=Chara braunii TaxID=69332 RepID=A0A388L777_CHABU|nr:hypothetical protein CBR_g26190 [Chara braunii]|eukprot:GBG78155.1 hypothetical protein CBR_g26190 [Chara braunii]